MNSADAIRKAGSIVIKIGSVLIRDGETDNVRQHWMNTLAEDVRALTESGKRVTIVSSGGIALGRSALGIPHDMPPETIRLEHKQAASAVGQFHLFYSYFKAFKAVGLMAAQVLLTMSETESRRMHLNARETLHTLLEKGIVPIINENDTVSTGEIRFGDNDRLAVRVAQMIGADAVILLSTIDGLYTADPNKDPEAAHIPLVEEIGADHIAMAGEAIPGLSTGGMKSKVQAAISAVRSGISLIVGNGMQPHPVAAITDKGARSTLFAAKESPQSARKKWIQAHLNPKGTVIVDQGAARALKKGGSLLPVGVRAVEGRFERGDAVTVKTLEGEKIAIGLSAYSAPDAEKIIGRQSQEIQKILGYAGRDELIHRNDLVALP